MRAARLGRFGNPTRSASARSAAVLRLELARACDGGYRLLALGAHADDLEIGCGGTVLRLAEARPDRRGALGRPERRRRAGARGRGLGADVPRWRTEEGGQS